MVEERDDRETEDLEADDHGDGPMDPLDPRLRVIECRDQLAVAERPVRTAEARIRRPHDDADRDEQERGRERQPGELLEAVQGALHCSGGPCGVALDDRARLGPVKAQSRLRRYPSDMPSPRRLVAACAVALLLAGCSANGATNSGDAVRRCLRFDVGGELARPPQNPRT